MFRSPPLAYKITNPRVLELYTKRPYWPQDSEEWMHERTKYLTASPLAKICKYGGWGTRDELFRTKTAPTQPRRDTAATAHGKELEHVAINKFEEKYGTHVLQFSLIPHDTKKWIAVSPDGITPAGEMIEVKCPYSREIKPAEAYEPWGCPKYYYPQVQAQLEVCDLEVCYFVQYWHKEDHMLVTKITRDRDWWAEHEPLFYEFWQEVLAFREKHPDWQTVDHHPPKVSKRKRDAFLSFDEDDESKLGPEHKKLCIMIDEPIVFSNDEDPSDANNDVVDDVIHEPIQF